MTDMRVLFRLAHEALAAVIFTAAAISSPAVAATLNVGPGQEYTTIHDAAQAARSGDTIRIAAGAYRDCAVWRADNLTIEGLGSGAEFSGPVCEGKGIFVILGKDVTVRNVKLAGAVDADGNGAGIREQGAGLTVENSVFANDQDGILADHNPLDVITIRDSLFDGDGACVVPPACAHGIYASHIALLHVERTRFQNTKIGHSIKSRALRTEIIDNTVEDGASGTSSYLIDVPNGGTLIMTGNVLEKGPKSENHFTAVDIGEEGKLQPSSELLIQGNALTNDGPPAVFVRNGTQTPAELIGNTIKGSSITLLVGPGTIQ